MKRVTRALLIAAVVAAAAGTSGCGGRGVKIMHPIGGLQKVVVAQYVVEWGNRWSGHTINMGADAVHEAIDRQGEMLVQELAAANGFEVVPFSSQAAGAPGFECTRKLSCPRTPVPWQTWDNPPKSKAAKKCEISPESAMALASAHGADAVLVAYSFWKVGSGFKNNGHVETKFKLYSRDGLLLAQGKKTGKATLGPFPAGQRAIDAFTEAARNAFNEIAVRLSEG